MNRAVIELVESLNSLWNGSVKSWISTHLTTFSTGVNAAPWMRPAPAPLIADNNVGWFGTTLGPVMRLCSVISWSSSSASSASRFTEPGLEFEVSFGWKNVSLASESEKNECEVNKRNPRVVLTSRGGRSVTVTAIICLRQELLGDALTPRLLLISPRMKAGVKVWSADRASCRRPPHVSTMKYELRTVVAWLSR